MFGEKPLANNEKNEQKYEQAIKRVLARVPLSKIMTLHELAGQTIEERAIKGKGAKNFSYTSRWVEVGAAGPAYELYAPGLSSGDDVVLRSNQFENMQLVHELLDRLVDELKNEEDEVDLEKLKEAFWGEFKSLKLKEEKMTKDDWDNLQRAYDKMVEL